MQKQLEAKKVHMTQIFMEDGTVVPVTIVQSVDNVGVDLENTDIEIVGTSKGKGFTGGMKKWNFKGAMATRGQSDKPRAPGSIGSQTPGRVRKGKKMAGRHGTKRVTLKGIKILKVDSANKHLYIYGPVPGARNSHVLIRVLGE